jgi:hypothetical protein
VPLLLLASSHSSTLAGGAKAVVPAASTGADWLPARRKTLEALATRQASCVLSPGPNCVRSAANSSITGGPPEALGGSGVGMAVAVPVGVPVGTGVGVALAAGAGVAVLVLVGVGVGVLVAAQTSAKVSAGGWPALSTEPGPHTQPSTSPGRTTLLPAPRLEYCQPPPPERQ